MTTTVTTASGARYEFADDLLSFRRLTDSPRLDGEGYERANLRRDGDMLRLWREPLLIVGECAMLAVEPLGEGNITFRTTTPIVSIITE
jgi:hypothetical protein